MLAYIPDLKNIGRYVCLWCLLIFGAGGGGVTQNLTNFVGASAPPPCVTCRPSGFLMGPSTVTRSSLCRVRRVIGVSSALGPVRVASFVCACPPPLVLYQLVTKQSLGALWKDRHPLPSFSKRSFVSTGSERGRPQFSGQVWGALVAGCGRLPLSPLNTTYPPCLHLQCPRGHEGPWTRFTPL